MRWLTRGGLVAACAVGAGTTWGLGWGGLTIGHVATRAGVAKTTLYRRWPTKEHLVTTLARTSMASFCAEVSARPTAEPTLTAVR